jgi:Cu/Ag efflux protein CusF
MKLQEMIDAAFGTQDKVPIAQIPTAKVEEPERAFSERAEKIETLRQTSLASAGETPPAAIVIEVVRFRGHWRTLHRKRHSPPFPDQAAAVAAAKKLALAKRKEGREVKVVLQRTDGNAVVQAIND